MNAPALNFKPKNTDHWHLTLREQLQKISQRDAKELEKVFAVALETELRKVKKKKRTKA